MKEERITKSLSNGLVYNPENKVYMIKLCANINDITVLNTILECTPIIQQHEKNNILVYSEIISIEDKHFIIFSTDSIENEPVLTLKELYPNETEQGFSLVKYKTNMLMVTSCGCIFTGNDILEKILSKRTIDDMKIGTGLNLAKLLFHGRIYFAVSAGAFFMPMRDLIKGDRVSCSDQSTYLVLDKNNLLTKIGRTSDISRRMSEFSNSNQNLILIAYCKEGKNETKLHKTYKHKRTAKEWYKLEPEDIVNIIKHYKMTVVANNWNLFFQQH